MHLMFPQWQGAGQLPELKTGAERLMAGQTGIPWTSLDIPASSTLTLEQGILGRTALVTQLQEAFTILTDLRAVPPLYTLGGDCSVELAPVSYLNHLLAGALTLVWLDAHADLNTPTSSPSGTFHGMPLRHLLGEGDAEVVNLLPSTLTPDQVVLAGVRELDPEEQRFIQDSGIQLMSAKDLNRPDLGLIASLKARGARKLYLHLDLDVLDPQEFSSLGWPTPGGVQIKNLLELLQDLHAQFEVVGGGFTEYLPKNKQEEATAQQLLSAWLNRH